MKIGFLATQLCVRGSTIALYDYAHYNELILKNESVIFYQPTHYLNNASKIEQFNKRFTCYTYSTIDEVDAIIVSQKIDALYSIKYGTRDNNLSKVCPNLVHAVFACEPHGERYAFVSKWLSDKYGKIAPYVPHMINLPDNHGKNLRTILNIPSDAIVYGVYGGQDSFDIRFVHQSINIIIDEQPNTYFIFMNIRRDTIEHDRLIYMPQTPDIDFKLRFINTCDAMIHGRTLGETFGLAIGEFSTLNKPVITYNGPIVLHYFNDKQHIEILGDKGIYYSDMSSLLTIFRTFKKEYKEWNCYKEYTPEKVMKIFDEVFLKNLKESKE